MGGGRDKDGSPVYNRVNGEYVRVASYKSEQLTKNDMKWLRRASYDGNIAYVNPDSGNLVATVSRNGEVLSVSKTELARFRQSRNMKTGEIKKAYLTSLVNQYKGGTEDEKFEALEQLNMIAKRIDPSIAIGVHWRSGVGTVIDKPVMQEVEKALGIKIL